jgi:hypothetical protein
MGTGIIRWLVMFGLGAGFLFVPEIGPGQERPAAPQHLAPGLRETADRSPAPSVNRSPLEHQMELSARAGADWLCRANRPDGRFVYGYLPALKTVLEGDHYLRQAGAAVALARAARYTANDHHAAVARQAILTLLLDTAPDSQDARMRHTSLPSTVVNRLAAAGLLVLAINELPSPAADLLQQSEELSMYIGAHQRADGSLNYSDAGNEVNAQAEDREGINYYPGEALYGLMVSQRHRPGSWKTEVVRKARPYYQAWWRAHPTMALVPWHTAAYAEAYLQTKEAVFAESAYQMVDWICEFQHERLDPRHPLWVGGFMGWADGRVVSAEPQVGSAAYAEALAEACRIAGASGDLPRYRRYRQALERCLQFLTTLQYTEANAQHFADWYRPVLVGGFHASDQDGNLRIDYTQHAVCALLQYLAYVAKN